MCTAAHSPRARGEWRSAAGWQLLIAPLAAVAVACLWQPPLPLRPSRRFARRCSCCRWSSHGRVLLSNMIAQCWMAMCCGCWHAPPLPTANGHGHRARTDAPPLRLSGLGSEPVWPQSSLRPSGGVSHCDHTGVGTATSQRHNTNPRLQQRHPAGVWHGTQPVSQATVAAHRKAGDADWMNYRDC